MLRYLLGFILISQVAFAVEGENAVCIRNKNKLYRRIDSCLDLIGKNSRRSCFYKIGRELPEVFWNRCTSIVDMARAEVQDEELTRYPAQGSALSELESQVGGTFAFGRSPASLTKITGPEDCGPLMVKARVNSVRCLDLDEAQARQSCFEAVDSWIQNPETRDSCRPQLSAIVTEMSRRSKQ
jgi:hypothetical protein